MKPWLIRLLLPALVLTASGAVRAHAEDHEQKDKAAAPISTEETSFGRQGDPKQVTRTIRVDMYDTMRFSPEQIRVKEGETIKFVVRNKGKLMHELVLGTMDELKAHGEAMKKHPEMEHDEPFMAHVKPGRSESLVWQFTRAGNFHFACLLPGHFEAGMTGKIKVAVK